jgi:hypothetical protein
MGATKGSEVMACFHTADATCPECRNPADQSVTVYHSPSVFDLEARVSALEALVRRIVAVGDKAAETRERDNRNYWRREIATELLAHEWSMTAAIEAADQLLDALEAKEKENKS